MTWVIVFVTFFGPLYDSDGFVTAVSASNTESYNSEQSCKFMSEIINGKLTSASILKENSNILKKKYSVCLSFSDWSNYKLDKNLESLKQKLTDNTTNNKNVG